MYEIRYANVSFVGLFAGMGQHRCIILRVILGTNLLLMSVPFVLWLILFTYVLLAGWYLAFIKFKPGVSIFQSEWVGLKYFIELTRDARFQALKNTVIMAGLGITINGFLLPILFALMLNECKSLAYKRVIQTVSYLPHFVSWIVVAGMVMQLLSPEDGAINNLLVSMGILQEPINFVGVPSYFYGIITASGGWKELGWNAIIFISAMAGIDQKLYEAAEVD